MADNTDRICAGRTVIVTGAGGGIGRAHGGSQYLYRSVAKGHLGRACLNSLDPALDRH
ncbi:hypothetical protein [Nocardia wallacei]|uniref:hypothetical protein n=1 Tax=Nocardia wallacei TaxID=480035 RepID=UPI002457F056|nr:hypothetical protein [Nocardia wallacei]